MSKVDELTPFPADGDLIAKLLWCVDNGLATYTGEVRDLEPLYAQQALKRAQKPVAGQSEGK